MSREDYQGPDTPYQGLMPYEEEDAAFFFGREGEREIIAANLMASRLTLLYGASGVGKSSVLYAGVAHHLRQVARANLNEYGAPEFAVVVLRSWRDDPLASLTAQVQEAVIRTLDGPALDPVPPTGGLAETLAAWAERVGGDLLIILDQFEEYFLYHPGEGGDRTFAVEFPGAVVRPDLRVNFLVSIREDALARLDRFKGRVPNLFDNYLRLEHLDREAARAAIEKPVEQYNRLQAGDGPPIRVEPALVEAVLDQVRTGQVVLGEAGRGLVGGRAAPGEARIETPFLQLVMTRLWEEETRAGSRTLRLATLKRLGGAEQIVRTHLDASMDALPPGEQEVAAHVFNYLVTPSGTKIAHTGPDLAEYAELPQERVAAVLEELSGPEVRVLRPVPPPPDHPHVSRYEIFHDVLGPAVLDWRARFVRAQERAEAKRQLAQERRRARRLRMVVIGLALLLVPVLLFALIQWTSRPKIDWAPVPAGEFLMGSDPDVDPAADETEMPQHPVKLDAYRIGRTEVTNAEYAQCVRATVCQEPADPTRYGDPEYAHHPIVYVSWFDAQTFCNWVGGRLPTEAEWEYAARGPEGRIYPWGDEPPGDAFANYDDNVGDTTPVGSYARGESWVGALDMAGNVWEWVANWYDDYPSTAQLNPTGPETGIFKVLRGGSWCTGPDYLRSAIRGWGDPDIRRNDFGFRCVVASTSSP